MKDIELTMREEKAEKNQWIVDAMKKTISPSPPRDSHGV
jgi:hypothetical protein